jgi:hypothetical protein
VSLIDFGVRGLIHVAGPEQVSSPALFDMLYAACRDLGVNIPIERDYCLTSALPGVDRRPPNTMLSNKRLERVITPQFTPLTDTVRSVAASVFTPSFGRAQMGTVAGS